MKQHIPVMSREVIDFLAPQKNKNYIDCTCGLGGHTKEILEKNKPSGKLLCIDFSQKSLNEAKRNLKTFGDRVIFVNDNFKNLADIIKENNFSNIYGILYDLGLASWQIENSGLGISFQKDETLNMNLATCDRQPIRQIRQAHCKQAQGRHVTSKNTAEEIVNKYPVKKLADILYQYGDMRNSWGIAKRIEIARRKNHIGNTFELRNILGTKNPKVLAPIFQALRIAVNNEFQNLTESLEQAINIIKPGGKIVVISYHSGEDRIVKNIFRENKNKLNILTKKPVIPSQEEINNNPRARSAKLRSAEKIKES